MMEYESTILVTRGDEMPKKNYGKKLHPTYEVEYFVSWYIRYDSFRLLSS